MNCVLLYRKGIDVMLKAMTLLPPHFKLFIAGDGKERETFESLTKQYKLEELNYIVEQRNPDDDNTLKEQNIAVVLSEELNHLTECAFSLNVLKNVFTLDANVKLTMSIQKEIITMR